MAGSRAYSGRVKVCPLLLLQLPGVEPLEHCHGAAAERTGPSDGFTLLAWRCRNRGPGVGRQQLPTQRQQLSPLARSEEAEEADANEAGRQHVLQEPPQELFPRQRHQSSLVAVGVVLPAKGDLAIGESDQAVVRDRNPVGVSCQVVENVARPAEGRLGVNDPVLLMERAYERAKCLFLSQTFQRAGQAELAVAIGMFESIDELTTKRRC